jgi:hypothetical protein
MRIWRHLKMLKRAGCGQDPLGAEATNEGELAVECPACPHPGRNLPEGWENAPVEIRLVYIAMQVFDADSHFRWLYTLFLAVDTNFRMGLKDKGLSDPELAPGWAYLVEERKYQNHLKNYQNQTEVHFMKISLFSLNLMFFRRSIHVVRTMTHYSMPIHAIKTAILSRVLDSDNVHVMRSFARMVSVIYKKGKSQSPCSPCRSAN